jgi:hypothetical protein
MERNIDVIGEPVRHDYTAAEVEAIRARPWYMGVPFQGRNGRAGVTYMRPGLLAVRGERLRDLHDVVPGEVFFGEMGHQLGWTDATFEQGTAMVAVNNAEACG